MRNGNPLRGKDLQKEAENIRRMLVVGRTTVKYQASKG